MFVKATKQQAKGRLALFGVSGSGKTWTGLTIARVMAGPGGKIAVIDTENGSASKYADAFDFDTVSLTSFTPQTYCAAIAEAEAAGYDVLVIDSISHAWAGKDGVLALVDKATAQSKSGNAFSTGWRTVTPEHNKLVDALVQCKCHLIVTCRQKADWVLEEDERGKKVPRKVGMAPVQREGLEYEFDVAGEIDLNHQLVISKSRCPKLADGVFLRPGPEVGKTFLEWLTAGTPAAAPKAPVLPQPAPATEKPSHDVFLDKWVELLTSRGFNGPAAIRVLMDQIPEGMELEATTREWRVEVYRAARAGAFDHIVNPPAQAEPAAQAQAPAATPADSPAPPAAATPAAAPATAASEAGLTWDTFQEQAAEIAIPTQTNEIGFEDGIRTAARNIGKSGKEGQITAGTLARWLAAMREGRFDWSTGKVKSDGKVA